MSPFVFIYTKMSNEGRSRMLDLYTFKEKQFIVLLQMNKKLINLFKDLISELKYINIILLHIKSLYLYR